MSWKREWKPRPVNITYWEHFDVIPLNSKFHLPFVWFNDAVTYCTAIQITIYNETKARVVTLSKLIFAIWIFAPETRIQYVQCFLLSLSSFRFNSQSALFNNQLQWEKVQHLLAIYCIGRTLNLDRASGADDDGLLKKLHKSSKYFWKTFDVKLFCGFK